MIGKKRLDKTTDLNRVRRLLRGEAQTIRRLLYHLNKARLDLLWEDWGDEDRFIIVDLINNGNYLEIQAIIDSREEPSLRQLREEARNYDIKKKHHMTKAELLSEIEIARRKINE